VCKTIHRPFPYYILPEELHLRLDDVNPNNNPGPRVLPAAQRSNGLYGVDWVMLLLKIKGQMVTKY
jgi:hypothetical protein